MCTGMTHEAGTCTVCRHGATSTSFLPSHMVGLSCADCYGATDASFTMGRMAFSHTRPNGVIESRQMDWRDEGQT
jgi:formate-dependent nitrite reductase cytochrome c552 subunit